MKTSWHGSAFLINGPLWWESTSHRWIALTNSQRYWPLMFHLVLAKLAFEQTIEQLVFWDASGIMWRHCNATKIRTWRAGCTVVSCAQIGCDVIYRNRITLKSIIQPHKLNCGWFDLVKSTSNKTRWLTSEMTVTIAWVLITSHIQSQAISYNISGYFSSQVVKRSSPLLVLPLKYNGSDLALYVLGCLEIQCALDISR